MLNLPITGYLFRLTNSIIDAIICFPVNRTGCISGLNQLTNQFRGSRPNVILGVFLVDYFILRGKVSDRFLPSLFYPERLRNLKITPPFTDITESYSITVRIIIFWDKRQNMRSIWLVGSLLAVGSAVGSNSRPGIRMDPSSSNTWSPSTLTGARPLIVQERRALACLLCLI